MITDFGMAAFESKIIAKMQILPLVSYIEVHAFSSILAHVHAARTMHSAILTHRLPCISPFLVEDGYLTDLCGTPGYVGR